MRYNKYINEKNDISVEDVLYAIYNKCNPFLKELLKEGNFNLLYSGRNSNKDYFEKTIRKDRTPMDMPDEIQDMLDDNFYEKFGIRARSQSMFCIGDFRIASDYGKNTYSIYAIGRKYKYIWNTEIKDLYTNWYDDMRYIDDIEDYIDDMYQVKMNSLAHEYAIDEYNQYIMTLDPDEDELPDMDEWIDSHIDEYINVARDEIIEDIQSQNDSSIYDLFRSYTDKNLSKAIKSKNEIMLMTDKVICVHHDYDDSIKYYFRLNGMKSPTSKRLHDTFDNHMFNLKMFNN